MHNFELRESKSAHIKEPKEIRTEPNTKKAQTLMIYIYV